MDFEAWTSPGTWRIARQVLPYVAAATLLVAIRLRFHGLKLAKPRSLRRHVELLVFAGPALWWFSYAAYDAAFVLPGLVRGGRELISVEVAQLLALVCLLVLIVLPLAFMGGAARRWVEGFWKHVSCVEDIARESRNFTDAEWRRRQVRNEWSAYKNTSNYLYRQWDAERHQPYMVQSLLAWWLFGKSLRRKTFVQFVAERKRRAELVEEMERQESA